MHARGRCGTGLLLLVVLLMLLMLLLMLLLLLLACLLAMILLVEADGELLSGGRELLRQERAIDRANDRRQRTFRDQTTKQV